MEDDEVQLDLCKIISSCNPLGVNGVKGPGFNIITKFKVIPEETGG